MAQEWTTVEQAAPALGMSKQGMYDAIRKGQLPPQAILRIGKRIRINLKALGALGEPAEGKEGTSKSAVNLSVRHRSDLA